MLQERLVLFLVKRVAFFAGKVRSCWVWVDREHLAPGRCLLNEFYDIWGIGIITSRV